MDSYRAFEDGVGADYPADDEPVMDAPPAIGLDERRMHVRAYNYWVSLLAGRTYPSIQDVDPAGIDDFGPHSVLLDFSAGSDDPAIAFVGADLRRECGLDHDIAYISEVPPRSLLSRLTDHYLQIIANCAPIGFEAEFVGQRGRNTMYRGILMPLSSDGKTIDFIYGVINWKEAADGATADALAREIERAAPAMLPQAAVPVWADGPSAEGAPAAHLPPADLIDHGLELGVDRDAAGFAFSLSDDAGLADRLAVARDCADAAAGADARSRAALYETLALAHDFAIAADAAPDDYAELLDDAGIAAQARAPMTPIVKLVFGTGYDKARITEYAAALSYARREGVASGGFAAFLAAHPGGLKTLVAEERRHRRPAAAPDRALRARDTLRAARPIAFVDIDTGTDEFVLLVARREGDGRLAVIAPVAGDEALVDRAIRKAA